MSTRNPSGNDENARQLSVEVNKCVLDNVQREFNDTVFAKPFPEGIASEAASERTTGQRDRTSRANVSVEFLKFCQQTKPLLNMMISQNLELGNDEFVEQCRQEIELLDLTEKLMVNDLVVWDVPSI